MTMHDINCDGCDHADHKKLYVHAACHINAQPWVFCRDGNIEPTCCECEKRINSFPIHKDAREFFAGAETFAITCFKCPYDNAWPVLLPDNKLRIECAKCNNEIVTVKLA